MSKFHVVLWTTNGGHSADAATKEEAFESLHALVREHGPGDAVVYGPDGAPVAAGKATH